jgi:hypothetical protein
MKLKYKYVTDVPFDESGKYEYLIYYTGAVTFILIGVLFAKRYIEQTIHYQRVRELVYVLETAHVARVIEEEQPELDMTDKISYEVGLTLNHPNASKSTGGVAPAGE